MPTLSPGFLNMIKSPIRFMIYLLSKLPSAYFAGVRVKEISEKSCQVIVPYKWFTRNPFRSTYFACLAMAGEMSTGILTMGYCFGRNPTVSMLVVKMEGEFFKKATGLVSFRCNDGEGIAAVVEEAGATGDPVTFTATSIGTNSNGEVIATFKITWSFKRRK